MRPALLTAFLFIASPLFAQSIPGRVVDAATEAPVPARVEIAESGQVVAAGADGRFTIPFDAACPVPVDAAAAGCRLTLVVSHPGYYVQRLPIVVSASSTVDVQLAPVVSVSDRVEVTATRAREGIDAVSFTNIPQETDRRDPTGHRTPRSCCRRLVPGVIASNDSGNGIGYSYFSIRGFGQARTRVMLNGAPLNDAESGELFFIDLADFMSTARRRAGAARRVRAVGPRRRGRLHDGVSRRSRPSFSVHTGAGSFGTRAALDGVRLGPRRRHVVVCRRATRRSPPTATAISRGSTCGTTTSRPRDYGERSRARLVLFGGPEQTHLAYSGDAARGARRRPDRRCRPRSALEPDYVGGRGRQLLPAALPVHPRCRVLARDDVQPDDVPVPGRRVLRPVQGQQADVRIQPAAGVAARWGGHLAHRSRPPPQRGRVGCRVGAASFSHSRGRVTYELQGEVRIHRAHHFGEVTWAQFYPPTVAPNQRYYDYQVDKNTVAAAFDATTTGHGSR